MTHGRRPAAQCRGAAGGQGAQGKVQGASCEPNVRGGSGRDPKEHPMRFHHAVLALAAMAITSTAPADALARVTGAIGVEDILGEVFSSFCIGK